MCIHYRKTECAHNLQDLFSLLTQPLDCLSNYQYDIPSEETHLPINQVSAFNSMNNGSFLAAPAVLWM